MNMPKQYAEFFFCRDLPFTPDVTYWTPQMVEQGREYYEQLRASLLTGDGALAEEVWTRHAPALVEQWRKRNPGTRPLCWFRFDSPLKAIPDRHPDDPHLVRTAPDGGYETQAQYLRRHGRLVPRELKILER
jgi:hypothetical protein